MTRLPSNTLFILAVFLTFFSNTSFSYTEIKALVEQQQYAQAYEQGLSDLAEWEGDPYFDYYYGQAALATDHVKEAIFAFERILISQPDQMRVKLELGRAYYKLQDFDKAKQQFSQVLANNPPEGVKRNIENFLTRIEQIQQSQNQIQHNGNVDISLGYDSNINSATEEETFFFKPFNTDLILDKKSRKTSDTYLELGVNHQITIPIHKRMNYQVGLNFNHKENFETEDYDTLSYGISGLLKRKFDTGLLKFPVSIQQLDLYEQRYLNSYQVGLGWVQPVTQLQQIEFSSQLGTRRYVQNHNKDTGYGLLSINWIINNQESDKTWLINLYYADEDVNELNSQHNGKNYIGTRLGFNHQWNAKNSYFLTANYLSTEHDAKDIADFTTIRADKQYGLSLDYQYKFDSAILLKGSLRYTDNQSNIDLYDYDRTTSAITFSYNY